MSRRADSLLIRNGRVVTPTSDCIADVFVTGGRIAAIGESLSVDAERQIDAAGLYVLPGGIDPHTHVDTGNGPADTCDGFTAGTEAAAFGGTTTIIDFCFQKRGESFKEALAGWHEKLRQAPPLVDVGFHLAVTDLEAGGGAAGLSVALEGGVTSLKLFMAYREALMLDDGDIFRVMRFAAEQGALVMVHAENGDLIEALIADALAAGDVTPRHHVLTRPVQAEVEATHRAIVLARLASCPLYVVHVSCADAAAHVRRAREDGAAVWAETCPQYLLADDEWVGDPNHPWEQAVRYVYSPPPRSKAEHDPLWQALAVDTLSVVSTDHNPFRLAQKTSAVTFAEIPNGAPGVETRLQLLHEFGVRTGRLSLGRLVELISTNPAKLFGLYPRKGTIEVGSDADLVLFDPTQTITLSGATGHSNADYGLFDGLEVTGVPVQVLVRGVSIIEGRRLVGSPGHGRFLARDRFAPQPLLPELAPAA